MQINITAYISLLYIGLLEVALVTEIIVAAKRWKEKKRGNFEKVEKYKKILRIIMFSPIIAALIPSFYLSVVRDENFFLCLLIGSIWPIFPFLALGLSAILPSSVKVNSPNQRTDGISTEKRKQKIRSAIIIVAAVIGTLLGLIIGFFF